MSHVQSSIYLFPSSRMKERGTCDYPQPANKHNHCFQAQVLVFFVCLFWANHSAVRTHPLPPANGLPLFPFYIRTYLLTKAASVTRPLGEATGGLPLSTVRLQLGATCVKFRPMARISEKPESKCLNAALSLPAWEAAHASQCATAPCLLCFKTGAGSPDHKTSFAVKRLWDQQAREKQGERSPVRNY